MVDVLVVLLRSLRIESILLRDLWPLAVLRCGRFEAGCAELELAPQLEPKVRLYLRGQL